MRALQCATSGCTSYATRDGLCAACRQTEADEAVRAVACPSCLQPAGRRCWTRQTVVFAAPRLRFAPHVGRLQLFRKRKAALAETATAQAVAAPVPSPAPPLDLEALLRQGNEPVSPGPLEGEDLGTLFAIDLVSEAPRLSPGGE